MILNVYSAIKLISAKNIRNTTPYPTALGKSNDKTAGMILTDAYSHFSNQLDLMSFNLNPLEEALSFDIIHPNAQGHRLLADLNYEAFKQGR